MDNEIRRLRNERGLSQAALGEALGVSRQTVNSLEAGRYDPSLPLAITLARYFGDPGRGALPPGRGPRPSRPCVAFSQCTPVPWSDAWQAALYGPRGFYRAASGPAGHFSTATHPPARHRAGRGPRHRRRARGSDPRRRRRRRPGRAAHRSLRPGNRAAAHRDRRRPPDRTTYPRTSSGSPPPAGPTSREGCRTSRTSSSSPTSGSTSSRARWPRSSPAARTSSSSTRRPATRRPAHRWTTRTSPGVPRTGPPGTCRTGRASRSGWPGTGRGRTCSAGSGAAPCSPSTTATPGPPARPPAP